MEKIVLFGDSITAGYGEEAMSSILQDQIQAAWQKQSLEKIHLINAGMLGHTTEDARKRVAQDVLVVEPTIVTIFFGANDVASEMLVPLDTYGANLLELIHAIGKEKVLLITPPYIVSARNPSREEQRVKKYVEKVHTIGEQIDIPVIDLYNQMLAQQDPEQLLQVDGLHFSAAGYQLLASLIVEEIKGRLKSKETSEEENDDKSLLYRKSNT